MTAPRIATEQSDPGGRIAETWLGWLQQHVETDWRPGQWDHKLWLFTADPDDRTNTARRCAVTSCDNVVSKGRLCRTCSKRRWRSGQSLDEFIKEEPPPRKKASPHHNATRFCEAKRETQCVRRPRVRGLCHHHYMSWRKACKRTPAMLDLDTWLATGDYAIPTGPIRLCVAPGCDRDTRTDRSELCHLHYQRFYHSGSTLSMSQWAMTQSPYVTDFQFTLIHLNEQLRWEILYAIQKRYERGARLDPYLTRMTIKFMAELPSLAHDQARSRRSNQPLSRRRRRSPSQ
jgi:hypothetical protein